MLGGARIPWPSGAAGRSLAHRLRDALFERLAEPAGECLLYELTVESGRIRSARRAT